MTAGTKQQNDNESNSVIKEYWDQYYKDKITKYLAPPSQFAVFFITEMDSIDFVVDFGCGNGRDSLFFASQGKNVIGIDQSETGVELCRQQAINHKLENHADFFRSNVNNADLIGKLVDKRGDKPAALYARFFLHAIDSEKEDAFLKLASKFCESGGLLAVEFRTIRDVSLSKVTDKHYRRFIEPMHFLAKAQKYGFEVKYFVEGFGYAKYKKDDAHVARFILTKS